MRRASQSRAQRLQCRFGKVCGPTITTSLVIGISTYFFSVCLAPQISAGRISGVVVALVFGCLLCMLLWSLVQVALSHPGPVTLDLDMVETIVKSACIRRGVLRPTCTSMEVSTYTGVLVPFRQCPHCLVMKLEGTHHCSTCRSCVAHMDHHCPWIGQCVGQDNHKHFILFLFYTCLCCVVIVLDAGPQVFGGKNGIEDLALFGVFMIAAVFAITLGPFLWVSLGNVGSGTSTIEKMAAARENSNTVYVAVGTDAGDEGKEGHRMENLRRVFGTAAVCPWWFIPVSPRKPPVDWNETLGKFVDDQITVKFPVTGGMTDE